MDFDNATTPLNIDMPRGVVLNRRAVDNESYALTDISTEGESDFNEFRAAVVQATIRLPLDDSGAPLRVFSPFTPPDDEEAKVAESKVDDPGDKLSKLIPDRSEPAAENKRKGAVDQHLDDLFGADATDDSSNSNGSDDEAGTAGTANPAPAVPKISDPDDLFGDLDPAPGSGKEEPTPTDDEFTEEELW